MSVADVKIRSPSQQSMCYVYLLCSLSLYLSELCNELSKIVSDYTQLFQSLSNFDTSKDILKSASALASEEKMIDNTILFSKSIQDNLKALDKTFTSFFRSWIIYVLQIFFL